MAWVWDSVPRAWPRALCRPVVLLALGVACSDASTPGSIAFRYGPHDHARGERAFVDENGVTADIESGVLRVEVPIASSTGKPVSGKLTVRLLGVDGKNEVSHATLAYTIPGRDRHVFTAMLALPESLERQDELVDYVVRIEDGAQGGLLLTRSLWHLAPKHQVELEGPALIEAGSAAKYRVRATELRARRPLAGQTLEVEIARKNGDKRLESVTTDETGVAVVTVNATEPGPVALTARTRAYATTAEVSAEPTVRAPEKRLLLTTDKPIYRPGERVHLRVLGLARKERTPIAKQPVLFEIADAKGDKVYERAIETDAYGVAATEFRIGPVVTHGTYTATVRSGDLSTQKTFDVFPYAPPRFEVGVKTDRPWYRHGDSVRATIDARTLFGKPLRAGKVRVEASLRDGPLFSRTLGELDAEGRYQLVVALPRGRGPRPFPPDDEVARLRVIVSDVTGHEVEETVTFPVVHGSVRLTVVPEGTELVPGVRNELWLFTADPLGNPVPGVAVKLKTPEGETLEARTDAHGQATVAYTPSRRTGELSSEVVTPSGETLEQRFSFAQRAGGEPVLVRTDKAVYEVGERVDVEIVASSGAKHVHVDWLNEGQAVDMRTLKVEEGRARFTRQLDAALSGDNRIEASIVAEDGTVSRFGRTIFVRARSELRVDVTPRRPTYAPGETARVSFRVTDETGAPRAAALGVHVVDRAVAGLVEMQPWLLRTHFELDSALARPRYAIAGMHADLARLLFVDTLSADPETQAAAQRRSQGVLAALDRESLPRVERRSHVETEKKVRARLDAHYQRAAAELAEPLGRGVQAIIDALHRVGCSPIRFCGKYRTFDTVLLARARESVLLADAWGKPWQIVSISVRERTSVVRSNGPDETWGTDDDGIISVSLPKLTVELLRSQPRSGARPGVGTRAPRPADAASAPRDPATQDPATAPAAPAGSPKPPSAPKERDASEGPRVRRDFPETLFVAPSVITDGRGTAELEIPLADGITEWRVTAVAHTTDGRLGGNASGLRVFQDFFVDVAFPAELTRGDEVTFPIAVHNYLDDPQSVSIKLEPASWYTPLGETQRTIQLEPGHVASVGFPVRIERVGVHTLTVRAFGTKRADAVARSVRVAPGGRAVSHVASGALGAGGLATLPVELPEDVIPGSAQVTLDVFPGPWSRVVSGMDALVGTPSHDFGHVAASAARHALAVDYARQTGKLTPEKQREAEAQVSAAYQSLLAHAHPSGGFFWYGPHEPEPHLTVSAFGLMQLALMSRVHAVDEALIARTVQWLVRHQRADGSWPVDRDAPLSFDTSVVGNTAFVIWALASAGHRGPAIESGLRFVEKNLARDDPYTLAIVANALLLCAPSHLLLADVLQALTQKARKLDERRVGWVAAGTDTHNGPGFGHDKSLIATALAVHALLQSGGPLELVNGGLAQLVSMKGARGIGSPQATTWALRAFAEAARKGGDGAVGRLHVFVDDHLVQTVLLTRDRTDITTRIDLSRSIAKGSHAVRIAFEGSGQLAYSLVANHNVPWTPYPRETPLPIEVIAVYDKESLRVNETATAIVTVKNNTSESDTVLVTLGIPPGFEVVTEDLEASRSARRLSNFDLRERTLTLAIDRLAPQTSRTVTYRLRATLPVQASDGGAVARLYYHPSVRVETAGRVLRVIE